MHQFSFNDIEIKKTINNQPGRTAFIDECGNFGFNFDKEGTSKYYAICAVVVKNSDINSLHTLVEQVKQNNGFSQTEMKSNLIGDNYKRRNKIIMELLLIDFKIVLLIAGKQAFVEGIPLTTYKKSFIKFLHKRLYDPLPV